MIKKPMLACKGPVTANEHELIKDMLPYMVSVKLDGIRIMTHPVHGPCTRVFKPIPNDYIREQLRHNCPKDLDGEIMTYNPDGSLRTFNEIQGDVMRKKGEPRFGFHVFDCFTDTELPFTARYDLLWHLEYAEKMPTFVHIVPHKKAGYHGGNQRICRTITQRRLRRGNAASFGGQI